MHTPFFQKETLRLTTLSPVHMGCGEEYQPTEYVVEDGVLYYFGSGKLASVLTKKDLEQLSKKAMADNGLLSVRQFIYDKRAELVPHAAHAVAVSSAFEEQYLKTIGRAAQVERGGRTVNNMLEVQRTYANPHSNTPILTGSGIKGAIRTALLNALNQGRELYGRDRPKPDKPANKTLSNELQKRLLKYEKVNEDPLRLLKISDAQYDHPEQLPACTVNYAINQKRKPSKKESKANDSQAQMLESIGQARWQAFNVEWTLLDAVQNPKDGVTRAIPEGNTLHQLVPQINKYYRKLLENELLSLEVLNCAKLDWLQGLNDLLEGEMGQALEQGAVMLLRLGKYGGADTKTLEGVRHIKIMGAKGEKPSYKELPTTYWLAGDAKNARQGLLPFGWVLLQRPGCELPETEAFIKEQAKDAYILAEGEKQRLIEREEKEKEIKIKREQDEAKAKTQAEEEAQKKQQWAAMSDTQREINLLQQRMHSGEGKGQGASAQLATDLTALIHQATEEWDAADRLELKQAAIQLYLHMGVDSKKNKKAKLRLKGLSE